MRNRIYQSISPDSVASMRPFGKGLNPKAVRAFLAGFGSVLDLSGTLSPMRRFHPSDAAALYHDWRRVGGDVIHAAESIKSRRNGKQFDLFLTETE